MYVSKLTESPSRPAWPYRVAAIGGVLLGIGAFLLLAWLEGYASSVTFLEVASGSFAMGGLFLGIGWLGLFRSRQGGFGVIASSLSITTAIAYVYLNRDTWELLGTRLLILLLAITSFTVAHTFVRGLRGSRVLAGITSISWILDFAAETKKIHLSNGTAQLVADSALVGLGLLGFSLVVTIPALRTAPTHDDGQ